MTAYYNEFDPYAAQWLRNLIAAGHIAPGEVDERSIIDVKDADLKGFTQCHFFAGIGGWSIAARLAGWPDEKPVWTGSCPCQPFSVAGKQKAQADERHLWPVWFSLIRECRPTTVFGEQVSGAIAHGWLDDVYQGLEGEGYAVGSAVLPACSVGAPHKRDRLWFVANADNTRSQGRNGEELPECAGEQFVRSSDSSETMGFSDSTGRDQGQQTSKGARHGDTTFSASADASSMAHAKKLPCDGARPASSFTERFETRGFDRASNSDFWEFEPTVGRVANGIPARSHKLRAFGNAIVPQVAAEFIKAFMEARP